MIRTYFPTAILIEKEVIPSFLNEEIKEYILMKESLESKNLENSWHSKFDLLENPPKCIKDLSDAVNIHFEKLFSYWTASEKSVEIEDPQIDEPKVKLGKKESLAWALIQRDRGYVVPHVHPHSTFTCTYFCQIPKTEDNSGAIELLNPVAGMGMSLPFRNLESVMIKPEERMLLIFPSYLKHWVHPLNSSTNRISIGFDIKIPIER